MEIKYKILNLDHKEHAIEVRYYTDVLTEELLIADKADTNKREDGSPWRCKTDYNLTIFKKPCTVEDVHAQIMSSAPIDWLDVKEHAETNENALSHLEHLVGKEHSFIHQKSEDGEPLLSMDEIEELLKKL